MVDVVWSLVKDNAGAVTFDAFCESICKADKSFECMYAAFWDELVSFSRRVGRVASANLIEQNQKAIKAMSDHASKVIVEKTQELIDGIPSMKFPDNAE